MSGGFEPIRGGRYAFIDAQEVRDRIDEAGLRTVVLVEGPTDERVFEICFYPEVEERLCFISAGGHSRVKAYIEQARQQGISEFRGIMDRDFRTNAERARDMAESAPCLYIHERYTLENYLIDSGTLLELLKDHKPAMSMQMAEIDRMIDDVYDTLIVVMAANQLLLGQCCGYLSVTMIPESDVIVSKLKQTEGIGLTEAALAPALEQIRGALAALCADRGGRQTWISGKYFFEQFQRWAKRELGVTLRKDAVEKYQLARILRTRGLPEELRALLGFLQAV